MIYVLICALLAVTWLSLSCKTIENSILCLQCNLTDKIRNYFIDEILNANNFGNIIIKYPIKCKLFNVEDIVCDLNNKADIIENSVMYHGIIVYNIKINKCKNVVVLECERYRRK